MRKFPKIIFQDVSLIKKDIKSFETSLNSMNLADIKIIQFSAGYVGSKSNPLKSIQFYSPKTMELIPENKINAQHKATVAALKKIILLLGRNLMN
jgi:hypothetical protein